MNAQLTTQETERRAACESKIRAGLKEYIAVGVALKEISDSRLYRSTHSTFEHYCDDVWGLSREMAYRKIRAAEVAEAMPQVQLNESQAAELAKLPVEIRENVLTIAASGQKLTAANIQEAARSMTQTETVRNLSHPLAKLQRDFKRTLQDFVTALESDGVDLVAIEEDVNWLFLEVESSVIARHPEMIPAVEKTLRLLAEKIEAAKGVTA
jgi:hypothetical protein